MIVCLPVAAAGLMRFIPDRETMKNQVAQTESEMLALA